MALPARWPVVQAFWKLNPPVTPSILRISPAKYAPGVLRLSKVRVSTSSVGTPPQVTNSSLLVLLPATPNWARERLSASLLLFALGSSAQRHSPSIPAAPTSDSQRRFEIASKGERVETWRLPQSARSLWKRSLTLMPGSQLTSRVKL